MALRIRVLSDLHLEASPLTLPAVDADLVVLAGDIAPIIHGNAPRWARAQFPDLPILWVLGNHEYYGYGQGMERAVARARELAREAEVDLLENDVRTIGDVRFLGCTLWTDFRLQRMPDVNMMHARLRMNDFSSAILIDDSGEIRFFSPHDSVEIHRRSVVWLRNELAKPFAGKTVVVTHHAPHPKCEHSSHVGGLLAPAFSSDLGGVIESFQPALWISGHTHASHDFCIGVTRLVSNQRGYRDTPEHADSPFDPLMVVEL